MTTRPAFPFPPSLQNKRFSLERKPCACVLLLGRNCSALFSTIWLNMDPAHTQKCHFDCIEEALRHQEAVMAVLASDATLEQNFASLAIQVHHLSSTFAHFAPANTSPDSSQVVASAPAPTQRQVSEPRIGPTGMICG